MSIDGADYLGLVGIGPKTITVKNSNGIDYIVTNPKAFLKHLEEAHGSGNESTHVENNNSFYVTQWFYSNVKEKVLGSFQ